MDCSRQVNSLLPSASRSKNHVITLSVKTIFCKDYFNFFNLAGSEGLHLTYGPGCPSFCSAGCRRISSLIKLSSRCMVGVAGIEPATSRLSGERSIHLSYTPVNWCAVIESNYPKPFRASRFTVCPATPTV